MKRMVMACGVLLAMAVVSVGCGQGGYGGYGYAPNRYDYRPPGQVHHDHGGQCDQHCTHHHH